LIALSLLVVWEYRDRFEALSSECELRDQTKSNFYNRPYERILNLASSGGGGHVVALAIPADLEEIQNNLCLGREYMSDVLRALAARGPSVVAIDKFYSAGTCASSPASTQDMIRAVAALKVPVVIGESTNGLEHQVGNSCLVRKPQLDFGAPNVRHGITRINDEPERLPLRWLVLASAPEEGSSAGEVPTTEFADTLSFAAVKAYDPGFAEQEKIRQMVAHDDHAYANLDMRITRMSTTQLLCSTKDEGLYRKWSLSCGALPALPDVAGKIVLIGAETGTDRKEVLGERIWGFELQARYMEALLSGGYLGYLPIWWGLFVFALFIFVMQAVPAILKARRPGWETLPFVHFAYSQPRYFWVVFSASSVIAVSAVVMLALHYLPPLLVYGDILLVAVTHLLIYLAESTEHPFVHAHHLHPREEHNLSTHDSNDHQEKPSTASTSAAHSMQAHASPATEPFVPSQPADPEPVPTSGNKPGSEAASEG
jgi:CHASE2 domain-containing sensor protein